MADAEVAARVAEIKAAVLPVNEVTLDRVIQQLGHIAFSDISKILNWVTGRAGLHATLRR